MLIILKFNLNVQKLSKTLIGKILKGKFLHGRISDSCLFCFGEFRYPTLNLKKTGEYLIQYYILLNCNSENCDSLADTNEDFILFNIDYGSNSNATISQRYSFNSIIKKNLWIKYNITLIVTNQNQLNVKLCKNLLFFIFFF